MDNAIPQKVKSMLASIVRGAAFIAIVIGSLGTALVLSAPSDAKKPTHPKKITAATLASGPITATAPFVNDNTETLIKALSQHINSKAQTKKDQRAGTNKNISKIRKNRQTSTKKDKRQRAKTPGKPIKLAALPHKKPPAVTQKKRLLVPSRTALAKALAKKGMRLGNPVYIRVFKQESRLEIWMQKTGALASAPYALFKSYKVCKWSGKLGPKIYEGDKQSPEGFYLLTSWQLGQYSGRWPQSLNLGFPNTYDADLGRTGSHLLVHGGCASIGCYAMTNARMDEIHEITTSAFLHGAKTVKLHAFPFKMTKRKMAAMKSHKWRSFWSSLKPAYDLFEATKRPPEVSVCGGRYMLSKTSAQLPAKARKKLQCQPVRSAAKPYAPAPFAATGRNTNKTSRHGKNKPVKRRRFGPAIVVKCNLKLPSCKRWLSLRRKKIARKSKLPPRIIYGCRLKAPGCR